MPSDLKTQIGMSWKISGRQRNAYVKLAPWRFVALDVEVMKETMRKKRKVFEMWVEKSFLDDKKVMFCMSESEER